jgi:hypothetical protein
MQTIFKYAHNMEIMEIMDKDVVEIAGTADSPRVILDRNQGTISFTGRSLPENPRAFYYPILNWLSSYSENPKSETHLTLNMDYFNTASSKMIMEVIEAVKKSEKSGSSLKVDWYYLEDDEEMLEAGQEFAELTDTVFNFISYE